MNYENIPLWFKIVAPLVTLVIGACAGFIYWLFDICDRCAGSEKTSKVMTSYSAPGAVSYERLCDRCLHKK